MPSDGPRVAVGGPWFEDFEVGRVYDDAPALTLTSGHAAAHQALVGDRLRLPLDAGLCSEVTGSDRLLAHPNLVCDVAIGQSTGPTQRVRGNLFYRGLVLQRPVFIGDTLRTQTEVVGLKQNRQRAGAPATGLVALRIRTVNQDGEQVRRAATLGDTTPHSPRTTSARRREAPRPAYDTCLDHGAPGAVVEEPCRGNARRTAAPEGPTPSNSAV